MPINNHDPRLECHLPQLVKLKTSSRDFSLKHGLTNTSIITGSHSSTSRGQGLDFEELRHYTQGDDIRNMDWPTTLRTGKPHVRCYNEEHDRRVIICVDQRSSMYFASVDTMKSVVAAEVAALITWRVIDDQDRVNLTLLQDDKIAEFATTRSSKAALAQVAALATANQLLTSTPSTSQPMSFSKLITHLAQKQPKQTSIIILSDWLELDHRSLQSLKVLQGHNDVLAVMITDPMEKPHHINQLMGFVMSDGDLQLNIDSTKLANTAQHGLLNRFAQSYKDVTQIMNGQKLRVLELDTSGQHIKQFSQVMTPNTNTIGNAS
ncbi:DUF58 domain-containing protein [Vibrio sp. E150_011]